MMSALYHEEGASLRVEILQDPEITDFIDTHAAILDSAFEETEMSDILRSRLQESDWMFSGMKTFHELNEAFPSLLDESGVRKPFEQFLKDVQSINETYNRNYLRAEYNFAQGSAEMAARWEDFGKDEDDYYLQYRTAGDNNVRPEHAALNGVTLPMSDKFWKTYYPPNGWNCRCTVVQVLKDRHKATDPEEAMSRGAEALAKDKKGMFNFNSGIEQRTFPAYNPYTISRCATCDKAKLNLAFIPNNQVCLACQVTIDSLENKPIITYSDRKDVPKEYEDFGDGWKKEFKQGAGFLVTEEARIPRQQSGNAWDVYKKEHTMCVNFAKAGHRIIHLREVEGLFDVFCDGLPADLKKTNSVSNLDHYVYHAIKNQGAQMVLIEFESESKNVYTKLQKYKREGLKILYYFSNAEDKVYTL